MAARLPPRGSVSHLRLFGRTVQRAGTPQRTSAKPVPVLEKAQPTPAGCAATASGRGAANNAQSTQRESSFPSAPLQSLACSITVAKQTLSPVPIFPTSPQAAAEPSLMESTLLAAIISINAALLALASPASALQPASSSGSPASIYR